MTVYWHDAGFDALPSLDGDVDVDLAIVGGGYTGLSTAITLKEAEPHMRIAIFERDFCGFGASGRNSGYVTSLLGHDLHTVRKRFGQERGRAVAALGLTAVRSLAERIKQHGIDCDFEPTGLATPALSDGQLRYADRLAEAAHALDVPVERWDRERCQRLGVPFFRGAVFFPDGGVLHPFKLTRGLVRVAVELGVDVFEGSPVGTIDEGTTNALEVNGHRVTAERLLYATNAYTQRRQLRHAFAPLHVYTVVTEPLTDAQLASIGGWSGRTGYYTLHHILYAFRLTADNRLFVATGDVQYFWGNKLHVDHPPTYRKLERAIGWFYPTLRDIRIANRWEGVVAVTLNDLPSIASDKKLPNVMHGLGYCGHGVALANYAGVLIRDNILRGQPSELPFVGTLPFPPVPGEPIRKPFASVYLTLLRGLDAWSNREARSRRWRG